MNDPTYPLASGGPAQAIENMIMNRWHVVTDAARQRTALFEAHEKGAPKRP